jgi:hypothetical protein
MSERKDSQDKFTGKVCEFPPDSKARELQIITENPAYVCGNCGRSAASHENLCRPERLFSSW